MKFYDISRELLSSEPYPGDPKPYLERILQIGAGEDFNLSAFYACCHSATHIDAPKHFYEDGADICALSPERFFGRCTVVSAEGILTGENMDEILPYCDEMILFHGDGKATLSQSAAFALCAGDVTLVGTDAMSIAPIQLTYEVHRELLGHQVIVLEGLDLSEVPDGHYLLAAFPLKIKGAEGAPARAVLISSE